MPARDFPNLGLRAGYDLGENGWGDGMTLNMLKVSVITQGRVLSKVASLPGSPTNGDVHILDETDPTNPNAIAVRDNGAWVYIEPAESWIVYNLDLAAYERFNGTAWVEFALGGGGGTTFSETITEAGASANLLNANRGKYQRWTGTGTKTLTVQPDATETISTDAEFYIANRAASGNLSVSPGSGVTINAPADGTLSLAPGMAATIKRVAEDVYDLVGHTVAA
jgi:hypothetical protein